MDASPVSFRSLTARFLSSTGAKVSGIEHEKAVLDRKWELSAVILQKKYKKAEDLRDSSKDHVHPKHPPPSNVFSDETTDDRTQDGPTIRRSSEQSDGKSSFVVVPYVGDRAARKGKGRRGKEPAQEATYK